MYNAVQTTILNEITFFGKPKNMEKVVNVKLMPADSDCGIVFKRVDLKENNMVKVNFENTAIENEKLILKNSEGAFIKNAEMLLAGIWAGAINNLIIEIDGDTLPYIDGSSEPFSFLFTICKTKELEKNRKIFEFDREIGMKIGEFEISVMPSKSFSVALETPNGSFEFDNTVSPYKDWLSKINDEAENKLKYNVIFVIVIISISNAFSLFKVKLKNFDKKITYDFFKNLFTNKLN